jgi:guanylate kinase
MYIIIGCSCAGKSTIEKILVNNGLNRIISYTSRPIRKNETNHIDYHYISDQEFDDKMKQGFFAESTVYNSWQYGIAKQDCKDDAIAVVETFGFLELKRNKGIHITSFFIDVEERERVCRMMKRGDGVMESFRRIISDQGSFSGIKREVDYVIPNPDGKLEEAVEKILKIIGKKETN